jgi:hypothetical protein
MLTVPQSLPQNLMIIINSLNKHTISKKLFKILIKKLVKTKKFLIKVKN